MRSPGIANSRLAITLLLGIVSILGFRARPLQAQEHGIGVFGHGGAANVAANDSEQGNAALWGGGVSMRLGSHLAVEGEATTAGLNPTRNGSQFRTTILTGSLLYLAGRGSVRIAAGGGLAGWIQRTRSEVSFANPPVSFCQDRPGLACREISPGVFEFRRSETTRVLHGRVGARWDRGQHLQIRVDGVLWIGGGIEWMAGAVAGVGYRF